MLRYSVEWVALCAGVKPALRVWQPRARAAAHADAARRRGFAVDEVARADGSAIVYIAPTAAAARSLREAEAVIAPRRPDPYDQRFDPAPHRRLGAGLGYPPCCVEAFIVRLARGVDRLPSGRRAHEDHVAAADARAASARLDARCNVFDAARSHGWLSHYPCRLDCAASIAYADAARAALLAVDAAQADRLATLLATAVAIEPDGRRGPPHLASAVACVLAFSDPP